MARTHTAFQPQSIASENQIAISLPRTQVEILVVTQAIQILDNPNLLQSKGSEAMSQCARGKKRVLRGNLGVSGQPPYLPEFHQEGGKIH